MITSNYLQYKIPLTGMKRSSFSPSIEGNIYQYLHSNIGSTAYEYVYTIKIRSMSVDIPSPLCLFLNFEGKVENSHPTWIYILAIL